LVEYQTQARQKIKECHEASAQNAAEIERAVEDGKRCVQETLNRYESES